MSPVQGKRLWHATGLFLLVIAGFVAIMITSLTHGERRQSEIEVVSTLTVDYVLDPTDARWRASPFAADFDITSSSSVVLRNGNFLYEIAHNSGDTAFSVVKVNGAPVDSLAIDNDDTLLTVAGGYFGMLDSNGDAVDAVPLPMEGMRLARSALDGVIYLYGGDNSDYRLYSFADNGAFRVLVQLDEPIVAVADNQKSIYIATGTRIFRLRNQHLAQLLKASEGEIGESIVSVAATPEDDLVLFSTPSRTYGLRKGVAVSIVNNSGGALRLRGDKLYVLDPRRGLLYTLTPANGGHFAEGNS